MRHLVKLLSVLLSLLPSLALATITHVGGAAAPTATGGTSAATPAINASATTGDLILVPAFISGDAAGESLTIDVGYQLLETITNNGTGESLTAYVWCKVHDGSEANPTVTPTGANAGDSTVVEIQVYRSDSTGFDCSSVGAIVNATAEQANAAATTIDHPALNVGGVDNTLILAFGAKRACESCDANVLATDGLGWNTRVDNNGTVGDDWFMVVHDLIQTTATNISAGEWTFASGDESQISVSILLSIKEVTSAAPDFDSDPALDSCTSTGCTFDYDANADADHIHGMCLSTAESTPTAAAIEAGTGSNGDADEATTGSADTLTITFTDSPVFPIYNCHFVAEEGTSNYSAVVSVLSVMPSAPTDMAFWPILSIGASSPCESFNAATDPDIAANDWLLTDDATSPGDFALTVANTCAFSYPGDSSPQSVLDVAVYDASAGGWHADDIDVYFNNSAPVCDNEETHPVLEYQSVPMTALDMDDYCVDPDVESLSYSVTTGSLNSGLSLNGSTGVLDGTPDTEDEAGNTFVITATDAAGATSTVEFIVYVTDDEVTAPDCVDDTAPNCIAALEALRPWLVSGEQLSATFAYSDTVAEGDIISQDPAASATMTATESLDVVVSLGEAPSGTGTWVSYARVWMFKEVRRVYLTTTAFKSAVEAELRGDAVWARWAPGTNPWSGSSNMQIDVSVIPGVPPLRSNGSVIQ